MSLSNYQPTADDLRSLMHVFKDLESTAGIAATILEPGARMLERPALAGTDDEEAEPTEDKLAGRLHGLGQRSQDAIPDLARAVTILHGKGRSRAAAAVIVL